MADFQVGNEGFGWVMSAFFLSYAFFQVPAGYLADRCDVRWVYAWAVAWWSFAAAALAFSPSLGILMVFGRCWGSGNRSTGLALAGDLGGPAAGRSGLGNGIFNSGAAVGAVLTPLVVTETRALVRMASRRSSSSRRSGLIWVIAWLSVVRGPHRSAPGRPERRGSFRRMRPAANLGLRRPDVLHRVARAFASGLSAYRIGIRAIWWGIACLMFGLLVACPGRCRSGR